MKPLLIDEDRLEQLRKRLEHVNRAYARSLGTKADGLAQAMEDWQSGDGTARQRLGEGLHRLASAGSFGFPDITELAVPLEKKLIDGVNPSTLIAEIDEFIAHIRARSGSL